MKNNGRQRFYLWDYLWWMGEKWKQARRTGRVDGEMMLSIYIFALLIFPMMTVTIRLFPGVSALLPCVVFSIVTFRYVARQQDLQMARQSSDVSLCQVQV